MIEVYFFRIDTAVIDCSIILLFSKMMTWDGIIETSTRVGSHWTDKEGLSGSCRKKKKDSALPQRAHLLSYRLM